ncbi:YHS domain-containing (seleno)protein [Kiloniella sp.]|uniref:YHS domain-containing (seleno)protein n=1 Tax=Kiloniella sp. TaxID=1938587 RepID=UPI003B01DB3D
MLISRRQLLFTLATGTIASALPTASYAAQDPIYTGFFSSVAIDGYDPVAYFTQNKPVEGSEKFAYEWMGASWHFASVGNLETFKENPESYAPQYGGYCSWAVAQGDTASADPYAWRIVNNKLYLNYSAGIQRRWERDISGNIKRGDANWPNVLD